MSIVVLDGRCRILRMNSAGRALLERGDLLVTTGKGLGCRSRKSTLKLRQAVHECLADDGDASIERVVILEPRDGKGFVPIFLRRFEAVPEARMVIAMLPMPPKDERIEFLARKMGLTRSEARIAALMRRGLSNKEMASIARLTEQTCSTYSKRVLSKLNVGRRAEIAQLLTWQSA